MTRQPIITVWVFPMLFIVKFNIVGTLKLLINWRPGLCHNSKFGILPIFLNLFPGHAHWNDTAFKDYLYRKFLFWETHQQGQQGLECFWKPASLLIEYEQNVIMIYFRIWNTPDINNTNYINVFRKILTDFSCVMCAKLVIFEYYVWLQRRCSQYFSTCISELELSCISVSYLMYRVRHGWQ